MNYFLEELQRRNLGYVIDGTPFQPIAPKNTERFANLILKAVEENLRVFIDPDCDPDGYFSALIIKRMFDNIGYTNYVVGKHTSKRHTIRKAYISGIINEGFDVIIIVDSSTNDMELINFIVDCGKLCAVIDHHSPKYSFAQYPAGSIIINPMIEYVESTIIYNKMSAGAICALICDYTLRSKFNCRNNTELYMYGYITLYSDCCDMSNQYNIAYIRAYQNTQIFSSDIIQMFWDETYSHFDRNFCSFRLVPRINALMRTESFDLLHKLFFDFESIDDIETTKNLIEEIYVNCKLYTQELVSKCTLQQHKNFSIVFLPADAERSARNFTGLVANQFASQLNQTCICLFTTSQAEYNGSVRDPYSRDMLSVFQPLCSAAGHGPAFGLEIPSSSLPSLIMMLDALEELFQDKQQDIIVIPWDNRQSQDDVASEMQSMSEYNEFGGQGLPRALGVMTILRNFKIYPKPKIVTVYGQGHRFRCFVSALDVGDTMLVSPTSNGAEYQLIVNSVKYN